MNAFLAETFAGLKQGGYYSLSLSFFNLAFLFFLVATVGYLGYWAARRDSVWKVAFVAAFLAMIFQTLALAFRWVAAGWDHPPFTNLYESLVFFAWGIVVVYVVVPEQGD